MSDAKEVKFSLKVMVNKEKTKVLFAESGSDFVDVLLSFLTLPLGSIVKVLKKHYGDETPIIGCLNNIYNSVVNLDSSDFWTEGAKLSLLNPKSSFDLSTYKRVKLEISDCLPEFFYCKKCRSNTFWSKSIYYDKSSCKMCGSKKMVRAVGSKVGLGGFFTDETTTFVITDDLQIVPNAIGLVQTINILNITGIESAEQLNVALGLDEVSLDLDLAFELDNFVQVFVHLLIYFLLDYGFA